MQNTLWRAGVHLPRSICCCVPPRRVRARIPKRTHKGRCMNKRLIWVEGDDFTGWCCSHCTWGITAPHLESTVAALAFNRLAQGTFEKHTCADGNHQDS